MAILRQLVRYSIIFSMAVLVRRPHLMMVVHSVSTFGITIRRAGKTVHVPQHEVLRSSEDLRAELGMDESDWYDVLSELQTLIKNCPAPSANDVKPNRKPRVMGQPTVDLMAMLKASLGQ